MAPSSDVNTTDEYKSNKSIVHKHFDETSSENLYLDVSESECNIFNKTLSQKNSSHIPTNIVTELIYNEHIEPSVSDKRASYFNIFECVRNLFDQLGVMYEHAFTSSAEPSSVSKGYYEPSPARERFYDMYADHIIEKHDGIDEDELRKAVAHM